MDVTVTDVVFFVVSLMALVTAWVLSLSKKTSFGPAPGRGINRVTLLVCVFVSALLFNLGLYANVGQMSLQTIAPPLLSSIRMMHGGGTIAELHNGGLPDLAFNLLVTYEQLLYLLAPVSTLFAIAELLLETSTTARMRRLAVVRDTYVLTPLNHRTLALAKDIQKRYRTPADDRSRNVCLVFAGAKADKPTALTDAARDMGALVLEQSAESALKRLLRTLNGRTVWLFRKAFVAVRQATTPQRTTDAYCPVCVVYDNDDEASNICRATDLKGAVDEKNEHVKVSIFAIAEFYSMGNIMAGHIGPKGKQGHPPAPNAATVRCVDWTRNLVEKTLSEYPLFLTGPCPPLPRRRGNSDRQTAQKRYLDWQQNMVDEPARHVVIVGAGHVGTEFLRLALSCSRMFGMSYRFDVIDNVKDPDDPTSCLVKRRLKARMPELLSDKALGEEPSMELRVEFHPFDALGDEYLRFIRDNCTTITYVFICLGADDLTTQVALRTREILERAHIERLARCTDRAKRAEERRRESMSLILGVVDDDELAKSPVISSGRRHIKLIGSPSHTYTYDCVIVNKDRDTDYELRQVRASKLHAKYRLFALARIARDTEYDISDLPIRWGADFGEIKRSKRRDDGRDDPTLTAILRYIDYCKATPARATDLSSDDPRSHEWLLRMEHSRWNVHTRAEGYSRATLRELRAYIVTNAQARSRYRAEGALLHPYLVPFDRLESVDAAVAKLYALLGLPAPEPYMEKTERRVL